MGKGNPSVLVIGAGATGMLAVIWLGDLGGTDVTIIEKADRVGETWRLTKMLAAKAVIKMQVARLRSFHITGKNLFRRWRRSTQRN